jgi:DDE superfamily endonuclease
VKRLSTRSSLLEVVFSARDAFSKRSWPYVVALAIPWLLLGGQRCITRLAALAPRRRSLSAYYRFLSAGKWRLPVLFRTLFQLVVRTFPSPTLLLVVDDTLVPKVGRGIFGTGYHFDHAARPRPTAIWGHNWLVVGVVVQLGGWAWVTLPFWVALYRAKKSCPAKQFRTRTQLAVEALKAVRTWVSGPILLLADGAYNHNGLAAPLAKLRIGLVSRLRYDARLREVTPAPRTGKRGPRPRRGKPLTPRELHAARGEFRPLTVAAYGKQVTFLVRERLVYWVTAACVIKVVISQDPRNPRRFAYLSSTDTSLSATQVLELFARRWSIEQLFSVCKNQLGFDSAEVRHERSVTRHAALTMALATWVEVATFRASPRRAQASFAHKLGWLREQAVASMILGTSAPTRRNRRVSRGLSALFSTATRVA